MFPGDRTRLLRFFLLLAVVCSVSIYRNALSGFWLDETFTGAVSCPDSFAAAMPLITHDSHPLLYHVLIHLMFGVTGCHLWLVRGISLAACGLAVFLLLREVGRRGGNILLATALTLGNTTFWEYAFEARSYGLLFLVGTCVVIYGLSENPLDRVKAVAFALLGGLLHYLASFLFGVLFLIALAGRRTGARSLWFWASFVTASVVLLAYYALQVPVALGNGSVPTWIPLPSRIIVIVFISDIFGNFLAAVTFVVLAAMTGSILSSTPNFGSRTGKLLFGLFWGPVMVMYAVSYIHPMLIYRYVHFLIPALVMGSALLVRDAERSLVATNPARAVGYTSAVFTTVLLYMLLNACVAIALPAANRAMGWQKAMQSMNCSPAQPCGFVLDDPTELFFTQGQYTALADFFAREPGSFVPLHPSDMAEWIRARPGGQVLYVHSFKPRASLKRLIHTVPLQCEKKYLIGSIGALPCRSLASVPANGSQ